MTRKMYEIALEEAVNTALADLGGLDYDEIVGQLQEGNIPDEISMWEPFENYDASRLYEIIDGFRAQFERFGLELLAGARK